MALLPALYPSDDLYPSDSLYPSDGGLTEAPGDNSELWELLYDSLGFHREDDPETGYQLRRLCEVALGPYQDIYDLLRERDDMPAPFALFLDPDKCPAKWLPYLAQYVGVVPTPEMSEAQLRAEIKEPTGWRRGQPEALRVATRRTLRSVAGEELMVIIRPRTPEVGHHYVRTLLSQTPEPQRTERVVRANLPAWEMLDYGAIEGVTYADIRAAFETYADLKAAFPTYKALREVLPTELPEP